jgi:hypothetical protein
MVTYYGPTDVVTYKHHYTVFGDEVLRAEFMERECVDRCLEGQATAEFLASQHVVTGRYAASFVVESGRRGGRRNDRAFAALVNVDPEAAHIEFGHDIPLEQVTYTKTGRRRKSKLAGPRRHVEGLYILTRSIDGMTY